MSFISKLTLTAFRNYETLRLNVDAQPIVLTGPNGAGKTNLLEAISLFAPGRGLRGAVLSEMASVNHGTDWAVAATISTGASAQEIGTGQDRGSERRIVRIDGQNRAQSALAELGAILWITPAMDRLFTEPASTRRKFIDRVVCGYDPAHATRVARYDQALRERQKLLLENRHPTWIEGLEIVLAETGVAIAAARRRIVNKLDRACAQAASAPFPTPAVSMQGELEGWLDEQPALAVEDDYRLALARNRRLDAASGRSALGAHRSDLAATHREKNMPAGLTSTGEQKALLIAFSLANVSLMQAETGTWPILVLDEITAHLDDQRRRALLERLQLPGLQTWMSGTDAQSFAYLGDNALYLNVKDGRIA